MKNVVLLLLVVLSVVSCGNKSSDPIVQGIIDSPGVTTKDDIEVEMFEETISAQIKHNPIVFEDGFFYLPKRVTMILPENLPVIEGRSGNYLSYVIVDVQNGTSLKCIYHGKGSNNAAEYRSHARPYRFDFCVEKSVPVSSDNRSSIKASSENIIDSSERATTEIELERDDKITVHVSNSNKSSELNITGKVNVTFNFISK
jgi:hypothetical protein